MAFCYLQCSLEIHLKKYLYDYGVHPLVTRGNTGSFSSIHEIWSHHSSEPMIVLSPKDLHVKRCNYMWSILVSSLSFNCLLYRFIVVGTTSEFCLIVWLIIEDGFFRVAFHLELSWGCPLVHRMEHVRRWDEHVFSFGVSWAAVRAGAGHKTASCHGQSRGRPGRDGTGRDRSDRARRRAGHGADYGRSSPTATWKTWK